MSTYITIFLYVWFKLLNKFFFLKYGKMKLNFCTTWKMLEWKMEMQPLNHKGGMTMTKAECNLWKWIINNDTFDKNIPCVFRFSVRKLLINNSTHIFPINLNITSIHYNIHITWLACDIFKVSSNINYNSVNSKDHYLLQYISFRN